MKIDLPEDILSESRNSSEERARVYIRGQAQIL
jgi:hypothetical protein